MKRRKTISKDSKRLGFRIDKKLAKQLKQIALDEDRSVAHIVEHLIREFIQSKT